ncbi:SufE family protein [Azomonas macrocytogenes]|uniref:Cysteine desulfuration protein SufE n=1 Tax=Azomonas macrocytogenes TaxID=69962 RepID=A0A839TB40_AZOMA|nr:SufE family protein [Azomonas macrocytogenes]MBB3104833.1 cysteine desulfuration protein SufE [Azomonas macrocytogenes]
MNALPTAAAQVLERFQQAASWEQRARLLMQWGNQLEAVGTEECNETNRIQGCESLVWLIDASSENHLHFRAVSDARILRGLLALLLLRINGLTRQELDTIDLADWFAQLGLSRQLSPSRSNGLNAVLQRMRELADTKT